MERLKLSWILHGNLQITGEEKVTFKISLPKGKLSKPNGSQFYVAAEIGKPNAVFTRRRKWKIIWKCHRHWNSDAHGPHWLIIGIFYCGFSAILTHPSLFRLVDWFCQSVRQQKPWLSLKVQLQCTKTRGEWQWILIHTKRRTRLIYGNMLW